jgi:cell division protein FtsB
MAFYRPDYGPNHRSVPRPEPESGGGGGQAGNGLEHKFLRIRRELRFWTRNTKVLLILVVILCIGGVAFGEYGLVRIVEVKRESRHLKSEITLAKMRMRLLEVEKSKLASDPFTLEKLARERCGFCKPGELIFVFPEDSTAIYSGSLASQASIVGIRSAQ